MTAFSVLFTLFCCAAVHGDHRKVEFSRIKNYELVYFQVADIETSQTAPTISFIAFGQRYDIELIENKDMAPSTIRHTNGLPTDSEIDHEYFTSPTTKSCHYFGKVMNDNTGALQRVSLSLCPGRGIRGEVHAFNETVVFKPAKYYLDVAFDSAHPHELTDEHLVYKMSDFDLDSEPAHDLDLDLDSAADHELSDPDTDFATHDLEQENTRRRTLYNSGNNQIEMLYLIDPGLRAYYARTYGSRWYTELYQDMTDNVNSVSSRYLASDFQSVGIGDVSVNLVELEVIEAWTGNYANLEPNCKNYPTCMTDTSHQYYPCECQIYPDDLRIKMRYFVRDHKDTSTFDAAQIISRHTFAGVYGMAQITYICSGIWTVSLVSAAPARTEAGIRQNMAHELGHNLGAKDNGASCSGIMGGGGQTFGTCALNTIKTKFEQNNGCTCLGDGVGSFRSNVDTNNNIDSNDYTSLFFALNVVDTDEDCDIYSDVVCVHNALGYNVSAWMRVDGVCENEMPVYELEVDDSNTTYYLHFEQSMKYSDSDVLYPKWIISADDMLRGSQNAYCEERDLLNCTNGKWYALRQENGTDYVEYTVEQFMMILNNDECVQVDEAKKDSWMNSTASTLAVILLVLICLLLVAGTAFCLYRKFLNKERTKKVMQMVPDEEEMVKSHEEEEIEVDVEVTHMQTR